MHKPKSEVNGPFAHQLALELTDQGDIKTNGMFFEASVPGVFCGRRLRDAIKGGHASSIHGLFWCRWTGEPAADSGPQGTDLKLACKSYV